MSQRVYLFEEGNAKMRDLLGGKGANLPRFVYDAYRRFIMMLSDVAFGLSKHHWKGSRRGHSTVAVSALGYRLGPLQPQRRQVYHLALVGTHDRSGLPRGATALRARRKVSHPMVGRIREGQRGAGMAFLPVWFACGLGAQGVQSRLLFEAIAGRRLVAVVTSFVQTGL
jgi:hypothetical protein